MKPSSRQSDKLSKSKEWLGALYPLIADSKGNIIDGKHRHGVDPDWPVFVNPALDDPKRAIGVRLVANAHRRRLSPKEVKGLLNQLAVVSGWSPQEISDHTGFSYSYVVRNLSTEHKRGYDSKSELSSLSRSHRCPLCERKASPKLWTKIQENLKTLKLKRVEETGLQPETDQ